MERPAYKGEAKNQHARPVLVIRILLDNDSL